MKIAASLVLVVLASFIFLRGQPTPMDKWACLQDNWNKDLTARTVYIHPGEVLELRNNHSLAVRILDVRPEAEFNIFHISSSQRLDPTQIANAAMIKTLLAAPSNMVFFLVSDGEEASTLAWKALKASGVLNLYIVEGGINKWLEVYPPEPCLLVKSTDQPSANSEPLPYGFRYAVGEQSRAARPDSIRSQPWLKCPEITQVDETTAAAWGTNSKWFTPPVFEKKVKLQQKVAVKGGCG